MQHQCQLLFHGVSSQCEEMLKVRGVHAICWNRLRNVGENHAGSNDFADACSDWDSNEGANGADSGSDNADSNNAGSHAISDEFANTLTTRSDLSTDSYSDGRPNAESD
jgi:hypothetical protein